MVHVYYLYLISVYISFKQVYLSDNIIFCRLMWVFYGHKNRSTQRIKPRNRILWLAIQIIMHRPSKYTDPFFDAGEFRRYMLTFPFDKLPFIDPLVCGVNRRFPALLSASIHVLFLSKKNKSTLTYIWTLISKSFTHGLWELAYSLRKG